MYRIVIIKKPSPGSNCTCIDRYLMILKYSVHTTVKELLFSYSHVIVHSGITVDYANEGKRDTILVLAK